MKVEHKEELKVKPKKKKVPLGIKIVLIFLVLFLILAGSVFAYLQIMLNKINKVDNSQLDLLPRDEESFEVDDSLNVDGSDVINPEEITWDGLDINVMRDEDVINILLIGQDRREGQGRQRSDTMIICSLNKRDKKITLSSVMRDLYVPIPGYSDNRINAAYQFGGMPLLDQVMEESLGIHIDGNVEVDFDGFINSLAVIGNLDIDLYQEEADYLNQGNSEWNLQAGVNSLTPEQALAYARTRYVGHSDWERTDRQRRIVMAAFNKVKGEDLGTLLDLTDEILPNLTTDMTNMEILSLVYTVFINGMTEMESYRIPVEGTYTCETLSVGMEVLVPDLNENSKYLQEYIYGKSAQQ
ncbi:MAG: LCP family protein [Lachnospiraceae bacterium]|nr:LCP family protein [Lachnospiraceae bacterium]